MIIGSLIVTFGCKLIATLEMFHSRNGGYLGKKFNKPFFLEFNSYNAAAQLPVRAKGTFEKNVYKTYSPCSRPS